MRLIKSFFERIVKDFRKKKLMPIKLIFFVKASTMFVLYPYLTLHMRELGITIEETAIMNSITPFIAIIMPPVAGLFADRIGNFKIMLSLFSALGGAAALLLLLVPVARTNVRYPASLVLATDGCNVDTNFIYGIYQNYPCDAMSAVNTELTFKSCGYSCSLGNLNDSHVKNILASRNYTLNVHNTKTQSNISYDYAISESDMPEKSNLPQDPREIRQLENIEYYEIATRLLSTDKLFFPAYKPRLFDFECDLGYNSTVCAFKSVTGETSQVTKFNASLKVIEQTDLEVVEKRRRYVAEGIECAFDSDEEANTVDVDVELIDELVNLNECNRSCVFTAPRQQVCTNVKFVIEYNAKFTFWTYLAVRVFIGVISGTTFPMFEGAVIAILREQKADYGLQRIYGSIGGMISSPLSGMLIDYASNGKGFVDLRPAFYLYAALKFFTSFLMLMIDLEFKAPGSKVMSDVMLVLKNIEVVTLLIVSSVLGIAWGYIESFLFWFLEDLGASRSLMGMTITVGGIVGIPLLILSGPIIDKIGHANVIFIGFICYAIRLLGYSLIYDPRLCLIFEALESITSSLTNTATVTYAAKLSTSTTDSTVQGLLGGLHHAVGKGGGSLIGGYLMKAFGTRPTYRIFSGATLLTGIMYFCFNVFYLSKRSRAVEDINIVKDPEEMRSKSIECKKEETIDNEKHVFDNTETINKVAKSSLNDVVENNETHRGSSNAVFKEDCEKKRKD